MGQQVTLLSTQTFSSSSMPPSGWTSGGGFFWSSNGDGGSNGSAVCDIWNYGVGPLSTPSINASKYAIAADSVWVDFDFFWEYNGYDAAGYGDDEFIFQVNSDQLITGTQAQLYTYYAPNDYNFSLIQTSTSYWRHYHVLVPVADRTSGMTVSFTESPNWGCSDYAIDNVTVTAFAVPPAELSLQPKSLNFGALLVGQSSQICTLKASSVGQQTLHIQNISLSGSNAFSIVSGPPVGTAIAAGSSASWCIQFLPLSRGAATGTLTVTTDGADSGTQVVQLTGYGAAPTISYGVTSLFNRVHKRIGDTATTIRYIPVTSTGDGPVTFNNFTFIGLNANNYSIAYMPQNPLPPGMSDSIGVRFTPTIEGRPDAQLIISTNATNKPLDTVMMLGVGTLQHLVITVSPPGSGNTVMFDSVAMGDSVCQSITLTNPGTDTLRILRQLVTYGDYDFSFYPLRGADTMIVPGGTKVTNICFKPIKNGFREASIRFFTNIPATFEMPTRDTSQFVVNINGIGVPYGLLSVTGPIVDSAVIGNTNCITDTLKNVGLADMTITSAVITGPTASQFSVSTPTPFTVPFGQTKLVSLCFTAHTRGPVGDTLTVTGTTSEHSFTIVLPLTGYGLQQCATASPLTAAFGAKGITLVGATDVDTITVQNCGDLSATFTPSITAGATTYTVSPNTAVQVAPGASTTFVVSFKPTAMGNAAGTLMVSGGPAPINVTLNGVGGGVTASATGSPNAPVSIGACQNFSITVTNSGNVDWTPGTATIGGANANDFTVVTQVTPSTIPAGETGVVTVQFCPKTVGTESMTLTFPNASPAPLTSFSYTTNGVGASSGVSLKAEQNGFVLGQSYPNPMNGTADVFVTLPKDAAIRIDLLDMSGAVVKTMFTGTLGAGDHTLSLDARTLASGTYFYCLTSGDVRLTREFILMK